MKKVLYFRTSRLQKALAVYTWNAPN